MASLINFFNFYLAHAAVIFGVIVLSAIVGEKCWQRLTRRSLELRSTIISLGSGAFFLVAKTIIGKALFVSMGLWVYNNHRLFDLDLSNPLVWAGVFLLRDFVYYWVHRLEHTTRFLWASHLVHHSPETIGMATAVRVPWMEALYKPFFSLWMPLLGFNPVAAIAFDVFAATLSQLQHTEACPANPNSVVGKVFVTPSLHRVHHGYNPEYIDKNFGAVLIVWDRMFGTYEPEVAPVKFGVGSIDAVHTLSDALIGGYGRLFSDMLDAQDVDHALDIAFAAPGAVVTAASMSELSSKQSLGQNEVRLVLAA